MRSKLVEESLGERLKAMLEEWEGQPRRERTSRRGIGRTIPNRTQLATVTSTADQEDAPFADWQKGMLGHPEIHETNGFEEHEAGECWLVPLQGGPLDVGRRYKVLATGVAVDELPVYSAQIDHKLRGVLAGTLTPGGSAIMNIRGNPDETVEVHDHLLLAGQTVAAGGQVTAWYDAVAQKWYVDAAQCPDAGGSGGGSPPPPDPGGGGGDPPPPPPGGGGGDPPPPPGGGGDPPPLGGCGHCIWKWSAIIGDWFLSESYCTLGCTCGPKPTFAGDFHGQEQYTLCYP